jgi:hypothetical protein
MYEKIPVRPYGQLYTKSITALIRIALYSTIDVEYSLNNKQNKLL